MSQITQLNIAIQNNPNDPALYYELGGAYLAMLKTDEALASYNKALQLAPDHPQILLQLGNTACVAMQYAQAANYFKRCIALAPNDAGAHYNLGNAYRELGEPLEAAQCYLRTLQLTPEDADAHNNLGNTYRELGALDKSIASYQQALKHNPQLHHALAHLIHQKQHICDWKDLDTQITQLRSILKQHKNAQIAPFAFLAMPGTTAEEQLLCANQWATQQFSQLVTFKNEVALVQPKDAKQKIRVAYLSADFRLHPLAFLITELLEHHDKSTFEIIAYSHGIDDASEERRRIEKAVDLFVDIHSLSDIEAAKHIKEHQIDILIDLTGYTKNSRSGIVALKPAPIAINWLGFPSTMGTLDGESLFNYILVDNTIAPEPQYFSEQCLYLPCYQPNNQSRPQSEAGERSDHQLPAEAFIFCCFNQTFKITAEVYATWMRILKQVPNSVLWLLDCNPWAKNNLIETAKKAGIAADRIIFAPRVSIAQHIARQQHADLFLDTLPYNAHTTASDALWIGLPVLTCMGETFSSRVCASLLKTLNLDDLITDNLVAYETLAVTIAHNKDTLSALKQTLIANHDQLFNSVRFTQHLESIYLNVYNKKLIL
ncbi:MAG: tetratricopeptide repeat protein [Methylophilus sp.]|nr:tetratricopeptide repeat protein [Methylophilus sp.]